MPATACVVGLSTLKGVAKKPIFVQLLSPLKPVINNGQFVKVTTTSSSCPISCRFLSSNNCGPRFFHLSARASSSLADEIMRAKTTQDQKDTKQEQQQEGGEGEPKKGPKPMTKWQKIGYATFGVFFTGSLIINGIIFSLPDKDENGHVIKDEFSELPFSQQYYRRLKSKFFQTKKDLEEPFSDRLLPDPLPEPYYQPKYTILLELTGLLVHSNWSHKHGWRFQKRPGLDMFLSQVGYPNFELVVYTTENAMTFHPIVEGLDPNNQYIMYRLFSDATRYVNGNRTKDLNALNRDPKKVIVVDWNENSVALTRDNALLLKKWDGDNADRSLIGLAQLLQAIKQSDVEDVREVLTYYKQFDDPIATFRENQRKLQDEMVASEELRKKDVQKRSSFFSGFSGLGSKNKT